MPTSWTTPNGAIKVRLEASASATVYDTATVAVIHRRYEDVEVDAMLCDHAEAVAGKLFINGAGITGSYVPPQPPHFVSLAIGLVIQVPYTETNAPHMLTVRLFNADGQQVVPFGAPDDADPVEMKVPFNVGRPPTIQPGAAQPLSLGLNFPRFPLAVLGTYSFQIDIDGTEAKRLPFQVMTPPGMFPQIAA